MDNDEEIYYGGKLPEIVYNYSDNSDNSKTRKRLRAMFPTKTGIDRFRRFLYSNYRDDRIQPSVNTSINRLYNLYKKSGSPRIDTRLSKNDVNTTDYPRAYHKHYPIIGRYVDSMTLPGMSIPMKSNPKGSSFGVVDDFYDTEFIAELSHAYQYNYNKESLGNDRRNAYGFPILNGDEIINRKTEYETPGTVEFNAHRVIEPTIKEYILNPNYNFNDSIAKRLTTGISYKKDNYKKGGRKSLETL